MISFSVVTCTYNAAGMVERTLTSVFEQTYPHVEHLIIDGVSKDETMVKVTEYKERADADGALHSVIVISEPDKGLYDAMNKGIDRATGDYIVFLNAGDVFPSCSTLEIIAGCVGDAEALPGVLYGDTDIVDESGRFLRHRRLHPPVGQLSWRSFRQGMLVCHQAFYARTDLAKAIHYNLSYRYSADVDWCIRIMKEAEQRHLVLKNVQMVAVNYLDGGMTVQNHRASLQERFRLMCRHYGCFTAVIMHVWFIVRGIVRR
ncbi:glycosyltransferase family 2 protein [Hoylesella oralis]|jgi:group 2 glycosyl transferase|uniref:glycosyltransferase family 2 protein n=1 Tax=Hoylesella oralis TaxID=28134 RepID=UPI0028EEBF69|nr:glycosyltransferase family 2 protein [Hoylesella oralis]